MAQKIRTLFIDDIDCSAAEGTVRFGLDGTDYEIDLSAVHAADLRAALAPFISAGRKANTTDLSSAGLANAVTWHFAWFG
jgi:hypothetical protein